MTADRDTIMRELAEVISVMRNRNGGIATRRVMLLWMAYDWMMRNMPKDHVGEYKEGP